MSTISVESAELHFPINQVWPLIRPLDQRWTGMVVESKLTHGASLAEVGSLRELTYVEGTKQVVQLTELSDEQHQVSYSLVSSQPAVPILGASHSIQLFRVTVSNSTLVQWTSRYPAGTSQEVVEDSRWKKLDAFEHLAAALELRARAPEDPWAAFPESALGQALGKLPSRASVQERDLAHLWERCDESDRGRLTQTDAEDLLAQTLDFMKRQVPERLRRLLEYGELEPAEQRSVDREIEAFVNAAKAVPVKTASAEFLALLGVKGLAQVERAQFIQGFLQAIQKAKK